jgi:hypothetical protein
MKNITKEINLQFTTSSKELEQELDHFINQHKNVQNDPITIENDDSLIDLNMPALYTVSLTNYREIQMDGSITKHKKVLMSIGTIFALQGYAYFCSYVSFKAVFSKHKVLSDFIEFFFSAEEYPVNTLLNRHAELSEFIVEKCYVEFKDKIKHEHGSTIQRVTQPLFQRQSKK